MIWNTVRKGTTNDSETVQHLFLLHISYKTGNPMKFDYTDILKITKLLFSIFVYKALNNLIDTKVDYLCLSS